MSTLRNNHDAIENLIFNEGLRINSLEVDEDNGCLKLHLNHDILFVVSIKAYKGLKGASKSSLLNFRLIGGGTGIHWPELDEDLSLKGFLTDYLKQNINSKKLVLA